MRTGFPLLLLVVLALVACSTPDEGSVEDTPAPAPEVVDTESADGLADTAPDAPETCTPLCAGRTCGDDGCGGSCGACEDAEACFQGLCVQAGELGYPCGSGAECPSGHCVPFETGMVCTIGCASGDNCPEGWTCAKLPEGSAPPAICLPPCEQPATCESQGAACGSPPDGCGASLFCGECGASQVCTADFACECAHVQCAGACCAEGEHCQGGACTSELVCTPPCEEGTACVNGTCKPIPCVPACEDGFHCAWDAVQKLPVCLPGGGIHAPCKETAECALGLSCKGGLCCAAADATCDGVDDDCDGKIDDEYVSTYTCGLGVCAAGAIQSSCTGGVETPCEPGPKLGLGDATCDGKDDDCDGLEDEDYTPVAECGAGPCADGATPSSCAGGVEAPCEPGPALAETDTTCDGVDDDCDGAVDEDYAPSGSCGKGWCKVTAVPSSCAEGVETSCQPGEPAASDTDCNGVDDDCNGETDEGYEPVASCGVGVCQESAVSSSCVDGFETPCQPGQPAATDATCDGKDDDCDGVADEDYVPDAECGLGHCAENAVPSKCEGGKEAPCEPGPPLADVDANCDWVDDDCDGTPDDDALPPCATGQPVVGLDLVFEATLGLTTGIVKDAGLGSYESDVVELTRPGTSGTLAAVANGNASKPPVPYSVVPGELVKVELALSRKTLYADDTKVRACALLTDALGGPMGDASTVDLALDVAGEHVEQKGQALGDGVFCAWLAAPAATFKIGGTGVVSAKAAGLLPVSAVLKAMPVPAPLSLAPGQAGLVLPLGPRLAGSTFDVPVRVNTGSRTLGSYKLAVSFGNDLLEVVSVSQGSAKDMAPPVSNANTDANKSGSLSFNAINANPSGGTAKGPAVEVAVIHFRVKAGAASGAVAPVSGSAQELYDTVGAGVSFLTSATMLVWDGQGQGGTGKVTAETVSVRGLLVQMRDTTLLDTSTLNGASATADVAVFGVRSDGEVMDVFDDPGTDCEAADELVAVTSGCEVEAVGAGQTTVTVSAGDLVAQTAVWVLSPELPLLVELADDLLTDVPELGRMQQTRARALATFGDGEKWSFALDVTAEVGFASKNPDVAAVDASGLVTAGSSGETAIRATGPGGAQLGEAVLAVDTAPEAAVGIEGVEVLVPARVQVTDLSPNPVPDAAGAAHVTATVTDLFTSEGQAVQSTVLLVLSDDAQTLGGSRVDVTGDAGTAFVSPDPAVVGVDEGGVVSSVGTGESLVAASFTDAKGGVHEGEGHVEVLLPPPVKVTATLADPRLALSAKDTSATIMGLPVARPMKVVVTFADGSVRDLTADPRTKYTPSSGIVEVDDAGGCAGDDACTPGTVRSTGTAHGKATVAVGFPGTYLEVVSTTVAVEVVTHEELTLSSFETYTPAGEARVVETELSYIEGSGVRQQAVLEVKERFTDGTVKDLTQNEKTTYAIYAAGTKTPEAGVIEVEQGTRRIAAKGKGTVDIVASNSGHASAPVTVSVVDEQEDVAGLKLTYPAGATLYGVKGQGTGQLDVVATFATDGTRMVLAGAGLPAGKVSVPGLLFFGTSAAVNATVDATGLMTARGNGPATLTVDLAPASDTGKAYDPPSARNLAVNLQPAAGDVDMGNATGLAYPDRKADEVFEVPIRVHTGAKKLGGVDLELFYDPKVIAPESAKIGGALPGGLFNANLSKAGVIFLNASPPLASPPSGVAVEVARVTFKALKAGSGPAVTQMGGTVVGLVDSQSQTIGAPTPRAIVAGAGPLDPEPGWVFGDANDDNAFTIADVLFVQQIIVVPPLVEPSSTQLAQSDLFPDGVVASNDAFYASQNLARLTHFVTAEAVKAALPGEHDLRATVTDRDQKAVDANVAVRFEVGVSKNLPTIKFTKAHTPTKSGVVTPGVALGGGKFGTHVSGLTADETIGVVVILDVLNDAGAVVNTTAWLQTPLLSATASFVPIIQFGCLYAQCGGVCCAKEQTCAEGACCTPLASCIAAGAECGAASDGCGGAIDCGGCGVNEVCGAGLVCECAYVECGGVCCPQGSPCVGGACKQCTPSCVGPAGPKACGADNGCGGKCDGPCAGTNRTCKGGECVCAFSECAGACCASGEICAGDACTPCTPSCGGKSCGEPNGCLGLCDGPCPKVNQVCKGGTCLCAHVDCEGKCCADGESCVDGVCKVVCKQQCAGKPCGAADGCGGKCNQGLCTKKNELCLGGTCVCPNLTCAGACCAANETCLAGACTCLPECAGKVCGADDGCGGKCNGPCENGICVQGGCQCSYVSCGGACCPAGHTCDAGKCKCTPSCTGALCGFADGCGGLCDGPCMSSLEQCVAGMCVCVGSECAGSCCLPGQSCFGGVCCTPKTCAALGASCGLRPDGCGSFVGCGECGADETCNDKGKCACKFTECGAGACCGENETCMLGKCKCLTVPCGDTCCAEGEVCGASGICCKAKTCVELGASCGTYPNGCGQALFCGSCEPNETCGADGKCHCGFKSCAGKCCAFGEACIGGSCLACKPDCTGKACGESDGCDGWCDAPCPGPNELCIGGKCQCGYKTCGGKCCAMGQVCNGTACCTPSCPAGAACGATDGCGGKCHGPCTGKPNQVCKDGACACAFAACGSACCKEHETCQGGKCTACVPKTCAEVGAACGSPLDGCGGVLSCGGCPQPKVCGPGFVCQCPHATCGGVCCTAGQICVSGACCKPSCDGKTCGEDDGCGAACFGQCVDPNEICIDGLCQCTGTPCGDACCGQGEKCAGGTCQPLCAPQCSGKPCGAPDGCGGTCVAPCPEPGKVCVFGQCQCQFVPCGAVCCAEGQGCKDGQCCTPKCAGKTCGAGDGCGGQCDGTCAGANEVCKYGQCVCGTVTCGTVCCPDGEVCSAADGKCCAPSTCAAAGAGCGKPADGCGGVLSCGDCGSNGKCNGAFQCECLFAECAGKCCGAGEICEAGKCKQPCTVQCEGRKCGETDGCGGLCTGPCDSPFAKCVAGSCKCLYQSCTGVCCPSGIGCLAGKCDCTPSCADAACGAPDGCGGKCQGKCPSTGETCVKGACQCGTPLCGGVCCPAGKPCKAGACCDPVTCDALGAQCGEPDDGCGGMLECGACPANEICNPDLECECPGASCGGKCCAPGQTCSGGKCCTAQVTDCASIGAECGTPADGCGGTLYCGACTPPKTCGAGFVCGCAAGASCGDTCCAAGETCVGGKCQCKTVLCNGVCCAAGQSCKNQMCCVQKTCADLLVECGQVGDGCGNLQSCGTCASGMTCSPAGKCECPTELCAGICCPLGQSCQGGKCAVLCQPQCGGKACGAPNGCGGLCSGPCAGDNQECVDGACQCTFAACGGVCCGPAQGCVAGKCGACLPVCGGKGCGADNGCGGKCSGPCVDPLAECVDGACKCMFAACGAKCCQAGQTCKAGACSDCVAECAGKACGDNDGCGSLCSGPCLDPLRYCQGGQCVCAFAACGAKCCTAGQACVGGICSDCTPKCVGKLCGDDDGCGGECVAPCPGTNEACIGGYCQCQYADCNGSCCGADESCLDGECKVVGCTPLCKSGGACGASDGCGGKCFGVCASEHAECVDGACRCAYVTCGSTCCAAGQGCNAGVCGCPSSCFGKVCGEDDGCGNPCDGFCTGWNEVCVDFECACAGVLCAGVCCGAGGVCHLGKCCQALTCETAGANCGTVSDDGCGGKLECGKCGPGASCSALNKCVCDVLECGESCCLAGQTCLEGKCCTPDTCDDLFAECGTPPDGCGGPPLDCGSCPAGRYCDAQYGCACMFVECNGVCCAAGVPCVGGVCKPICFPACGGKVCGASDGCGGLCDGPCTGGKVCQSGACECPSGVACGAVCCEAGQSCKAGQCCTPVTKDCAALGAQCGEPLDSCGAKVACGGCQPPRQCSPAFQCTCPYETCGSSCCGPNEACVSGACKCKTPACGGVCCGTGEQCVAGVCCKLQTCASLGAECGSPGNGCGAPLSCGTCGANASCNAGFHCECNGVSCGGGCCKPAETCKDGTCVPACLSNCQGKMCGEPNGCNGLCDGACASPNQYCESGQCKCLTVACGEICCAPGQVCLAGSVCGACNPQCGGKPCGAADGCGSPCNGPCSGQNEVCEAGACVCQYAACGELCCDKGKKCQGGACVACTPQCAGKSCGDDDGCGWHCEQCPGLYKQCVGGKCVCTNVSCEGTCCAPGEGCSAAGKCEKACTPTCSETGPCGAPDGCGGKCWGTCGGPNQECVDGACQCLFAACAGACCGEGEGCVGGVCKCAPSCLNKLCGAADGCGGKCKGPCPVWNETCVNGACQCPGTKCGAACCAAGESCVDGHCQCVKSCQGKVCGDADGCGGLCVGPCPGGADEICDSGECVCIGTLCGATCCPIEAVCGAGGGCCIPKTCEELGAACGLVANDGCGGKIHCGDCPANAKCNTATNQCECYYSKCGTACCGENDVCKAGACCTPGCAGKLCGELEPACGTQCDGPCLIVNTHCVDFACQCFASCGSNCCALDQKCIAGKCCHEACGGKCCDPGQACVGGVCCTPQCAGKVCGDADGCGGICGACADKNAYCDPGTKKCLCTGDPCASGCCAHGEVCESGVCVCPGVVCNGSCCPPGFECDSHGNCTCLVPCGDKCCGSGESCVSGACVPG